MIHMNLIAVAEKSSTIGSVSQHLHVTNVADVERRVKRKYLTIGLAALFAVRTAALRRVLFRRPYYPIRGFPASLLIF